MPFHLEGSDVGGCNMVVQIAVFVSNLEQTIDSDLKRLHRSELASVLMLDSLIIRDSYIE